MRTTTFKHAGRTFLLLLPLLLGASLSRAADYNLNGLYFNLDVSTRTATLTNSGSYNSYSGAINIPETFVGPKSLTYKVSAIGDNAFRGCSSLTAVSIPVTVETIGAYAFYGCSSLPELSIPSLVKNIGPYAFYNCSSLTAMALPPLLTTIKAYTFYGCSKLTSVTIPSNLTAIESNAFYGCTKLPRVTLPQKLTAIGDQAFYGCTSLATVSMSQALATIGSEAFRGCASLTSIILPEGLATIGSSAFYGTSSLQSVTIPSTLTSLGTDAFSNSGLQTLTYADGCTTAFRTYATGLTTVTIPATVTAIADRAFYNCSLLSSAIIPWSVRTIGESAYYGCAKITKMTIPARVTSIGVDAFANSGLSTLNYANNTKTALRTWATQLTKVTLPSTLKSIADNCFYGCTKLSSIILPEGLETIGGNAFYNCSALTTLTVPQSLTAIGTGAFSYTNIQTLIYAQGCTTALRTWATTLTTVSIPNTLYRFAPDVFKDCNSLENIHIADLEMWNYIFSQENGNPLPVAHRLFLNGNLLTVLNADFGCDVANYAFALCKGLKQVNITNSIPVIGTGAFMQCPDLEAVAIGSGTERIGTNAFQGCTQLSAVRLGNGLKVIGKNAFYGCSGLNSLFLGDNVQRIDEGAFRGCYKLPQAKLPATLTTLGPSAFRDCYELLEVIIPAGVTAIPDYAFYDCRKMETLEIGEAVTVIGSYAFYGCKGLKTLNVPDATKTIGDYAFANCESIRCAYLGTGISNIGSYAFANNYYVVGFYCRAISVPACSSNAFSGSDPQFCELYVPDESLTAYSGKSPWSSFGTKTGLASAPVFVSTITLSSPVLIMEEGDVTQITATVAPQNATNKNVNWASSNTDVVYVSKSGGVMSNEEGLATITCRAADDNGATAKSLVIVANNFKAVTGLTLSNTTLSLVEGKEAHLTASTDPATATYSDVTWSSSNPLVAQVSEVGLVTAIATGTATITCAAADGKGAEATCAVTVTEAVDPTIGDANEDGNVSVGDLTYAVSVIMQRIEQGEDISLYDLDGDGEITIQDVVAIADIILGYNVEPAVRLLELSATELTIGISETTHLNYQVIPYKMNSNLTWASSDETVVTVTDDGTITALKAGTAIVTLTEPGGLTAECRVTVDASYGSTDGHSWVDLGLPSGTRWATVNLGALSQQEYGSYYAWGETQPKDNYTWNTYLHSNGSATTLTKYCTTPNKGTRDDKTLLEPADDAATAAWGSNWCMPTEDQFLELFNPAYTTSVWTEQNGLYGRRVTSRVNGNTLFLPAAGYMNGTTLSSGGSGGYYATRNLSTNDCDYNRSLSLGSSTATLTDTYRCYGQSVRPVGSTHIDVTPATAFLQMDETLTLQAALVTPSGTSSPLFTWTSSNSAVATVNSQGKVTAKTPGKAIIYASLDNGLRGSCIITVSPLPNGGTLTVNGVTFRMVHVAGGTFQMGATSEQGSNYDSDERPVHSVTLSDYWIGETEVTQALWYAVMGQRPTSVGLQWSSSYGLGDNYPAYYVSWNDCQTFIQTLNELTGMSFRLPTEAEWEFAARGGNSSQGYKYSGSNTIGDVAWYTSNSGSKPHPVATKSPNELGLYDMSGNVREWCQDWYGSYSSSAQTDPVGPSSGSIRVDRGGSWHYSAGLCRVANRNGNSPSNRSNDLGLRLALSNSDTHEVRVNVPMPSSSNNTVAVGTFSYKEDNLLESTEFVKNLHDYFSSSQFEFILPSVTTGNATFNAVNGQWTVKGISGASYKLHLSNNNKTILCESTPIVELDAQGAIHFIEGEIADDILNYKSHQELGELETFTAYLKKTETSNTQSSSGTDWFNVRFLRPLTLERTVNASLQSFPNNWQNINLGNFVKVTDWRNTTGDPNNSTGADSSSGKFDFRYYQVTLFTDIMDIVTDAHLSNDARAAVAQKYMNNMNNGKRPLEGIAYGTDITNWYDVAGLEFQYKPGSTTTIQYKSNGGITGDFHIFVPVYMSYVFGQYSKAYQSTYVMVTVQAFGESDDVTVNGVSFRMVHVAGGTFQMGATSEQGSDAYDNEKPVHSVTLSDYWIGETEVTQALWQAVMGQRPTSGGSQWNSSYGLGDNYPAYYVSWNDCQEFITRLNQLTGQSFRLPTEAEWEFAARGGNNSQGYKYSGSNTVGDVAWYSSNSGSKTHPVATKSPNELGLYDMSGNVWEWCQDWYGSYSSSAQTDPVGPSSGSNRVDRGGCWGNNAGYCRVAGRNGSTPSSRYYGLGLRLAF